MNLDFGVQLSHSFVVNSALSKLSFNLSLCTIPKHFFFPIEKKGFFVHLSIHLLVVIQFKDCSQYLIGEINYN